MLYGDNDFVLESVDIVEEKSDVEEMKLYDVNEEIIIVEDEVVFI